MHVGTMKPTKPLEVFFSYSHKDEKMRERLEAHLSTLKRENVIAGWHDRKINPGEEWKGKIDEHLEKSDIILLLISADFLASDYCYDVELDRALARHEIGEARVIPIILRPCEWPVTRFGKLQALPRDGKPVCNYPTQDHAFSEVVRGIRRVVEETITSVRTIPSEPLLGEEQEDLRIPVHSKPTRESNKVPIPKDVIEMLERMRIINALAKTDEEALFDDDLMNEYRAIQEEMVDVFMPLVKLLVKAGLLTMSINIDDIDSIDNYSTLTGEPTAVFDNGNIWIDTEYGGGNLRQSETK